MEKEPCKFDDKLVLRQLQYTGMLATVRLRQSGYNYRVLFEVSAIHVYMYMYVYTDQVVSVSGKFKCQFCELHSTGTVVLFLYFMLSLLPMTCVGKFKC